MFKAFEINQKFHLMNFTYSLTKFYFLLFQINVFRVEHEYIIPAEAPIPPRRVRSRSRTSDSAPDDDRTSRGADSINSDFPERNILDLRDEMGYAIVDKSRSRQSKPPTPRRSRSLKTKKSPKMETKFFTTPRPLNDTAPTRPTRAYSTLGPSRPPRKKSPNTPKDMKDDKENIDISQYTEIDDDLDDEHSRDLQSGDIISKMKGRPLPAPPRPPRKDRDRSKDAFRDITQDENILRDPYDYDKETFDIPPASTGEAVEEIEVSTQTDPLPEDFLCEEILEEPTDKIVAPRRRRRSTLDSTPDPTPKTPDRPKTPLDGSVSPHVMIVERKIQTPVTDFDGDSITHASIIVKPVAEYPSDSYVSQRFSADLPDLMPEILSSVPKYTDEELESFQIEEEHKLKSISTSNTLNKALPDEEIQELLEEMISSQVPEIRDDEEFRKHMLESTEDDLICDIVTEIEEPPEIPEKPLRMKLKLEQMSESKPQPPQRPPPPQIQLPTPTQEIPLQPQIPTQPHIIERIIERPVPFSITPGPETEVEILKAARLQVTDLDVERLNVNELQANKILVSEIDGVSLQISELSSKSGNIVVNGLEIPSGLIQEILDKLQPISQPAPPPPSTEQVSTQTDECKSELKETSSVETQKVTKLASEQIDISDSPLTFPPPPAPKPEPHLQSSLQSLEQSDETKAENTSSQEKKKLELISDDSLVVSESVEKSNEELVRDALDDILTGQISALQRRIATLQEQMTLESMLDSEEEVIPDEPLSEFDESLIAEVIDEPPKKIQNRFEIQPVVEELVKDEIETIKGKSELFTEKTEKQSIMEELKMKPVESSELKSDLEKPECVKSETEESVIPKEFSELQAVKSEQTKCETMKHEEKTKILEPLVEAQEESLESKTKQEDEVKESTSTSHTTKVQEVEGKKDIRPKTPIDTKMQRTLSQPVTPSETLQENVLGNLAHSQVLHGLPFPVSYYPELVHSTPPQSFHTLQSPHTQDLSEEDIPVHHKRRRPQRRMSQSSSEEEPRTVSRRHITRSPEPSIPQLTGQLVRASAVSLNRIVKQLLSYVNSRVMGTPEGKQDLQIAMIIILVLIAGLILLGYGGNKTVHLHHWEYFNPPTDL